MEWCIIYNCDTFICIICLKFGRITSPWHRFKEDTFSSGSCLSISCTATNFTTNCFCILLMLDIFLHAIFSVLCLSSLKLHCFFHFTGQFLLPLALIKHPPSRHFIHNEWPELKTDILGAYCYLPRLSFSHGWNLISYKACVAVCQTIRENIVVKLHKIRQNTSICLFQIAYGKSSHPSLAFTRLLSLLDNLIWRCWACPQRDYAFAFVISTGQYTTRNSDRGLGRTSDETWFESRQEKEI